MKARTVKCDYCDKPAKLVTGAVIYPHRMDLRDRWFWHCAPCDAYVGTHRDSKSRAPFGRLANAELRAIRKRVHAMFDPIWKSGRMGRNDAYAWLAERMGISAANCHVGMFDVDQCKAALAVLEST